MCQGPASATSIGTQRKCLGILQLISHGDLGVEMVLCQSSDSFGREPTQLSQKESVLGLITLLVLFFQMPRFFVFCFLGQICGLLLPSCEAALS